MIVVAIVIAFVVGVFFMVPRPQTPIAKAIDEFYGTSVASNEAVFLFMNESTFLVKTTNHVMLIDPGNKIRGDDVNWLKKLDLILVTHTHSDHFNVNATINIQAKTGASVLVNPGAYASLDGKIVASKLVQIQPNENKTVVDVSVKAILAVHPGTLPLMYVFSVDGVSMFTGSDSGYSADLISYAGQAKIAMVPTGWPSPSASPAEALKMVQAMQPQKVICIHGTAAQNDSLKTSLSQQMPYVDVTIAENLKTFKIKL